MWPEKGLACSIVNFMEMFGIMMLICYVLSTVDLKRSGEEDDQRSREKSLLIDATSGISSFQSVHASKNSMTMG